MTLLIGRTIGKVLLFQGGSNEKYSVRAENIIFISDAHENSTMKITRSTVSGCVP